VSPEPAEPDVGTSGVRPVIESPSTSAALVPAGGTVSSGVLPANVSASSALIPAGGTVSSGVRPVIADTVLPLDDGYTGCKHNTRDATFVGDGRGANAKLISYCEAKWCCDGQTLQGGLLRCRLCNLGVCRRCWRKAYPDNMKRQGKGDTGNTMKRKYGAGGEESARGQIQKRRELYLEGVEAANRMEIDE
jgi:hypothetical protein